MELKNYLGKSIMQNKVKTKEDFIQLLSSLAQDVKYNPKDWENRDLPSFLEAMASWIEDMDGFYSNQHKPIPTNISWEVFADIMLAARIYE